MPERVDIVFPTYNRLEFTQASLAALFMNTNWEQVRMLFVYDDGSRDGTREWLETALTSSPVPYELRAEKKNGPVGAMRMHLAETRFAPLFAKIDNDIVVPPGWLDNMLSVLDRFPHIELLGMEAGMTRVAYRDGVRWDGVYDFRPSSHVGGVGVFKVEAFHRRPELQPQGRQGFTEWQHAWDPVRGWIEPDLAVVQLDRLPFEPWCSLTHTYVKKSWQRSWPAWDERMMAWAWEHMQVPA